MSAFSGAIRGVLRRGDEMYARQTEADRYQKELEKIQRELDLREQAQNNQNAQFYRADDTNRYQIDTANDQFGKRLGEDTRQFDNQLNENSRQFNEQLQFNEQQLAVEKQYKESMGRYYNYLEEANRAAAGKGRQVDFNALANLAVMWGSLGPEGQGLVRSVMNDGGYSTDFIDTPQFKYVSAETAKDPALQQGAAVNAQRDAQENKGGFWNTVISYKGVGGGEPQAPPNPNQPFQQGKLASSIGNFVKSQEPIIAPGNNTYQAGKLGKAIFGGGANARQVQPAPADTTQNSGISEGLPSGGNGAAPGGQSGNSGTQPDSTKFTQLAGALSSMLKNIPGGQNAPQQPTQSPIVNSTMNPVQRAPTVNPTVQVPAERAERPAYTPAPALPSTYKEPGTNSPVVNSIMGAQPPRLSGRSAFGAASDGVQRANAEFANSQPPRTIGTPTGQQSTVRMPNMASRPVTSAPPQTGGTQPAPAQPGGMGSRDSIADAVKASLYRPKSGQGLFFDDNEYQSFSAEIQKLIEDSKKASPFSMGNRNKLSRQIF